MRIAVVADIHGNFELLYSKVQEHCPQADKIFVPGDLSPFRNMDDFKGTKIPEHHRLACKFEYNEYYEGRKKIPIPTYFIGGNHEPNNVLKELSNSKKHSDRQSYIRLIDNLYFMGWHSFNDNLGFNLVGISGNYSSKYYDYKRESLPLIRYRHFVKEDIDFAYNIPRINCLLIHDFPAGMDKYLTDHRHFPNTFSPQLAKLIQDKSPDYVFAGHMHFPLDVMLGNTRFISLRILNENSKVVLTIPYKDHIFYIFG